MNSEREIVKRLFESKDIEVDPRDEELEEASFEAGGKHYSCAFGRYSCDGEPISREDYFRAKEGGSAPSGGASVDSKSSGIKDVLPSSINDNDYTFAGMLDEMDEDYIEELQDEFDDVNKVFGDTSDVLYYDDGNGESENFRAISDLRKTLNGSGIKPTKQGALSVYDVGDGNKVAFSNKYGLMSVYYTKGRSGGSSSGGSKSSGASKDKTSKSKSKYGEIFKGMSFEDWFGKKASSFGPDDSTEEWDEHYETLATVYSSAQGLGCDVDNLACVTEENGDLYAALNYIRQEGDWDSETVDHDYSNISSTKFTNKKTGDQFVFSHNYVGMQTFQVDKMNAFDPMEYVKDVDPDELEDYRW